MAIVVVSFADWLSRQGCTVEITQEDDGSGYVYLAVTTPEGDDYEISVTL